jgi:hypothetical protein
VLFLIEYDRQHGHICSLREWADSERLQAGRARLELELQLRESGTEREVVLLEADSEAAMRKTHRRYFESIDDLASAS